MNRLLLLSTLCIACYGMEMEKAVVPVVATKTDAILQYKEPHRHRYHHDPVIINIEEGTGSRLSQQEQTKQETTKFKLAIISGISALASAGVTAAIALIVHFTTRSCK